MKTLSLLIVLSPLFGAIIAGVAGKLIGKKATHWITILSIALAFFIACYILALILSEHRVDYEELIYTWGISGKFRFDIVFLIDGLSAVMMVIVTFISLLVHVYSVGYMRDDDGYQRFFSYMSLFTFFMLVLVLANNFLLLFLAGKEWGLFPIY